MQKLQTLLKEIKDNLNEKTSVPKSEYLILLRWQYCPKLICRFNTIPITIPAGLFVKIDKVILMFIWKAKESRIAQIISKMNNKLGGLTLPGFKAY